jgi:hypothetical protein
MGAQTNNCFTPKSESLRLVAYVVPAPEWQILDVPKAEREAHIHHHNQADDLRRRVEIAKRAGCFLGRGIGGY